MSSDFIQNVRNKFDYAVMSRCQEAGCELKLSNLTNYIVLKGELLYKDKKMADCIIFVKCDSKIAVGIIELKSKTVHVKEVIEKLTNSLEVTLKILEDLSCNFQYSIYLIVLSKKWDHSEYRIITSKKIKLHGKSYLILPKKCNDSFSLILKRYEQ